MMRFREFRHLPVVALVAAGLALAGCGSSSSDKKTNMMDDGMKEAMCPEGQTGTPPNCVTPPPPGPTPAEIAAMTAEAKTKLDAIMAEAELATDSGLGGTEATAANAAGSAGAYNLSVKRTSMATTVTVSVQEGAAASAEDDEKFMQAEDLGGGRTMHIREHDPADDGSVMTEIAMVMTDIAAPKAVAFAKWDNDNDSGNALPQALNARADGETVDAENPADSYNLGGAALASSDAAQKMILDRMMASVFGPPSDGSDSVEHTFGGDDPNDADDKAASVRGEYNGAMGSYTCVGGATDCTVTVNAKGMLTAASAGWVFTPDKGAMSDQPDYDYLNYGFWLKKTDEDGVTEYDEVALFHTAVGMSDSTGTITGSASYEGSAVGVYVHNVLSEGGGKVESRTAGHFTADASLMAYFGQPDAPDNNIPPNKLNTITGMIDNFMLSGDENQDWSVALKGDIDTSTFAITDGSADGGGTPGGLSGQFYGAAGTLPGAASGEFDANFSNGSVAGAFGVRKK